MRRSWLAIRHAPGARSARPQVPTSRGGRRQVQAHSRRASGRRGRRRRLLWSGADRRDRDLGCRSRRQSPQPGRRPHGRTPPCTQQRLVDLWRATVGQHKLHKPPSAANVTNDEKRRKLAVPTPISIPQQAAAGIHTAGVTGSIPVSPTHYSPGISGALVSPPASPRLRREGLGRIGATRESLRRRSRSFECDTPEDARCGSPRSVTWCGGARAAASSGSRSPSARRWNRSRRRYRSVERSDLWLCEIATGTSSH
jgi:hypothetical protein